MPVRTGVTGASYTDTGLSNGSTYYYYVTAVNDGGVSPQSNEAYASAYQPAPAPLLVAHVSGGSVSLDTNYSMTSYQHNLYRGTAANAEGGAPYQQGYTNFWDSGVSSGTTYFYKATAVDWWGQESYQSAEASATPGVTPPAGPLTTGRHDGSTFVLTWNPVAGATSYAVYSNMSVIAIVTGTSWTDPAPNSWSNYCHPA